MGGRIAEQVRRALLLAAKTGSVAVAIDVTGCSDDTGCAAEPHCVPATGTYEFEAIGLVYPSGAAGASTIPAFNESEFCKASYPATSIELPLESCRKFCSDPRYEFPGKYADTDTIVSCSTYDTNSAQPPAGCFPMHVACTAEYPPGAKTCDPIPL